jgi:hypothetical protein
MLDTFHRLSFMQVRTGILKLGVFHFLHTSFTLPLPNIGSKSSVILSEVLWWMCVIKSIVFFVVET